MKIRYAVENNLISYMDASYSAAEVYETEEDIKVRHESGACLYKVEKGKHVLRSQGELESDPLYKEWKNSSLKQALSDIDMKSIRSIREWLSKQASAPQRIKDYEAEAQEKRDKLI